MKKVACLILLISILGCKNKTTPAVDYSEENLDVTTSIYPENITKVFNAHGGLETWNAMKTLSFTMEKPNGKEVTTVDLKTRAELIDTPTHTQGYDGSTIWIKEKGAHKNDGSRAKFYRGLMMYFYAMPFIVADDGVIYDNAEPLVFEGKTYPGILISYEAGVGTSPDDQYIIYYDAETGQMQWLGYTVTFGQDGKSKDFHFIKYSNWQTIAGLVVPETLTWYNYENHVPTEKRNDLKFTDIKISKESTESSIYNAPEGAFIVE